MGLSQTKLEHFRKILLEHRERVLNRSASARAGLTISTDDLADETDHAAAVIQQGLVLNVQERERHLLREIEHALSKFEDGTYGLCEDTEEPIEEARLNVQPWTRYSVEAAELREKRSKRFASGGGGSSGPLLD